MLMKREMTRKSDTSESDLFTPSSTSTGRKMFKSASMDGTGDANRNQRPFSLTGQNSGWGMPFLHGNATACAEVQRDAGNDSPGIVQRLPVSFIWRKQEHLRQKRTFSASNFQLCAEKNYKNRRFSPSGSESRCSHHLQLLCPAEKLKKKNKQTKTLATFFFRTNNRNVLPIYLCMEAHPQGWSTRRYCLKCCRQVRIPSCWINQDNPAIL